MLHLDAHTPTARSQTSVLKSDLKIQLALTLIIFSVSLCFPSYEQKGKVTPLQRTCKRWFWLPRKGTRRKWVEIKVNISQLTVLSTLVLSVR